jgi:hypothetical protein
MKTPRSNLAVRRKIREGLFVPPVIRPQPEFVVAGYRQS